MASDVKDRNPFKDRRVRQAVYHAINVELIVQKVLRGQAAPTGAFLSTRVDGSPAEFDRRLPYDPAKAKALLAEAGYPNGFSVGSTASTSPVARTSARRPRRCCRRSASATTLRSSPTNQFFPKLSQGTASFIEFGWTPKHRRVGVAERAVPHLGQERPRHLQRRPLQQPEARRADRCDARRARPDTSPRDGRGGAAHGRRRPALRAAVPPHADVGDDEEGARRAVAERHPSSCAGCASKERMPVLIRAD